MRLRELTPADTPAVHALLRECRLPTDGVPEDGACFAVAEHDGEVAGVAGLELHGGHGLLRSVAVSPAHRGRGLASRLCDEVEKRAAALGVRRLFLLTESAEKWFARRGYAHLERALAPPEIAKSREFSALCPDSATLMFREL